MIEAALAIPGPTWLAFLAAVWALNLTPGSDVMFITATGAAGGTRAGLAAALGIVLGSLVHVALAVLGVAALIQAVPAAYALLRWGGAAYLLWLAFTYLTAPPPEPGRGAPVGRALVRGVVNCALNPKVSVFILAFLPQFADPARGPLTPQIAVLGLTFAVASIPINGLWALVAGAAGASLRRFGTAMNRVAAGVMVLIALRLVWERR